MNWKKSLLVVPLGVALLLPTTTGLVSAQEMNHTAPTVTTPGAELRSTLDHYLSEHVYLAIETMRKGAEGAADFEASAAALGKNTDDLSKAVGSVYGDAAGKQFHEMWSKHIGFFVDYVKATANKDEAAKQDALDKLGQYKKDFSEFLATATDQRLEAGALAEGLQMHVDQLVGAFDSYVAGDYAKAYEYERESIHHMYMISKGLSSAITDQYPDKFKNTKAVTPASDLRADLNYLLAEHAGLAVDAMQNGIDGSKDFEASANALAANTDDLSAAIASVYGEDAGKQFKEMWSGHIGNFVEYVKATGAKDEDAKKAAMAALDNYRADFSKFIETATDGKIPASALSEGLQMHVNQLVSAFDSYVAKDYDTTYASVREAYGHMYETAGGLSGAIVSQFPDKFTDSMPTEMPKTGLTPPSAANQDLTWVWALAGLLVVMSATGIIIRKKSIKE